LVNTESEREKLRLTKSVSRPVDNSEEVRGVDERSVRDGSHHGDRDGLLFLGLRANGGGPAEDDTVDTVSSKAEDDHGDVSTGGVGRWKSGGEDESEDGDKLTSGDVPRSLIVLSGRPRDEKGSETGNQVWWTSLLVSKTHGLAWR